jgi:hypothetical protein
MKLTRTAAAALGVALALAPRLARAAEGLQLTPPALVEAPQAKPSLEAPLLDKQLLLTTATAALVVPAMMAVGTLLGRSSSNLYAAALPALLLYLLVPPAATAWVAQRVGLESRAIAPGFWIPALAGFGVHLAATALGIVFNVSSAQPLAALVFALVEAVVMAPTTAVIMDAFADPLPPPPAPAAQRLELPPARPLLAFSFPF